MGSYIMDLRKVVGHRPLLQAGASVIVEDGLGRILLQKRSDDGTWGYAGGSLELFERVEDAARRELLEEAGLTAGSLTLLGVYSGPELHNIYPNGDEVCNVDSVFVCTDYKGELICQAGEVESLRFFAPDELPEDLFPPNVPAIRDWLRSKGKTVPVSGR